VRLKNDVSVQRLVEASGVALKKAGKDWMGRCPLHEDETASLVVTPGKNLWHCFGCGEGGGPIDWVMKRRGVSFRHAVELAFTEQQRELAAGDVLRFTHNDHRNGIVNGERAKVASIDAEQGRIVLDKPLRHAPGAAAARGPEPRGPQDRGAGGGRRQGQG
jgi:hypothetical protein